MVPGQSDSRTTTEKTGPESKPKRGRRVVVIASGWRLFSVCLLARVVGRIDVIDFPRSYAVDLKNGFRIEEGEMGGLGLHDRYSACWNPHDLGFIEVVTDPDIESAGHHRDMLDRWMPMSRDLGPGRELDPDHKRHGFVHRPLNEGKLHTGPQRRNIFPLKLIGSHHRVCTRPLRIGLRNKEKAKCAQEGGGCCNLFHNFLLEYLSGIATLAASRAR